MSDVELRPLQSLIPASSPAPGSSSAHAPKAWTNGDSISFRDVLDIVNPLQHIPVVGTLYRAITGDTIAAMPSIIGGTIFGGPVGLVLSLADNAVKAETGKNVGETVMAGLFGSPADKTAEPLVAKAEPAAGANPPPKLVIDIPAPRHQGEQAPQAFADGKPPVVINLPQPKWALEAGGAQPVPAPGAAGHPSAPTASPVTPVKAGMPLTFQNPPAKAAAVDPAQAMPARADAPRTMSSQASPLANARFRSTDMPQPAVDGGVPTHSGADLVATPGGTAITRDAVPNAMTSALDKYAAMMRARQAQQSPTQVSVLR